MRFDIKPCPLRQHFHRSSAQGLSAVGKRMELSYHSIDIPGRGYRLVVKKGVESSEADELTAN